MKILLFALERPAAELASRALRSITPDAVLAWARSPDAALNWLTHNRDADGLIVDPATPSLVSQAFLEHVRTVSPGLSTAVLAPRHMDAWSAAFKATLDAATDQERTRNELLQKQLKEIQEWRQQAQERLALIQAEHQGALSRTNKICTVLQERLLDLEGAVRSADQRHAAQTATAEQLARREAELSAALVEAAVIRTGIERRLSDAEAARQHAERRAAEELTAASERYTTLEDRFSRETGLRASLEERLAAAEIARADADQHHATELAGLTTRLADREAQHDASAARTTRICTALQERLLDLESAACTADDRRAADAREIDRLGAREQELRAALADAVATRTTLEQRLSEAGTEHARTTTQLTSAIEQSAALEAQLRELAAARSMLERRLDAADAARHEADQLRVTEVAALAARLSDVQALHDAAISQNTTLEWQLRESGATLEDTRRDWTSEVTALAEQLARREAEAGAALAEATRAAAAEIAAADARYAALQQHLGREVAVRTTLEERLVATETGSQDAARQHATELASITERLIDLQGQYDSEVKQRTEVEQRLADVIAALEQARRVWHSDVAAAAERLARRETELNAALLDAAAARAAVEGKLRDAELAHQHAHARATAGPAQAAERHAALQEQLRTVSREVDRLQLEGAGLRRQLDAVRRQAAAHRRDAERVPALQLQIEASQKENRRQFERAPYGLCECTRDGAISRVNHSLARMLGYRSSADLRHIDDVSAIFECPADLRWLVERTLRTGKVEAVETTLKTRDHRRLSVRLHALTSDGPIVVAVEDLTRLSAIEHRLREARRLEAVGRVASEVAVTCDTLLRDVSQGGRQWLAGFASDTELRQQGELLLGDVTRAAGFLRQFVAYGQKQISNLEPVNVRRVLRDLEPVLKRVLGDEIVLVLPRTTERFEVDVDTERVEQMLVNVANSARERMPHGGRLKVHLATTLVEQRFLARHPKVRPGAHVLITITETRGVTWRALPVQVPTAQEGEAVLPHPAENPGLDPGPLVALIGDLGGHLWMSAEPGGNMTVRIHLPKRIQGEMLEPAAAGSWSNRGRQLARWFRH